MTQYVHTKRRFKLMPKMARLLRADHLVCCCTLQSGLLMIVFFTASAIASSAMSVMEEYSGNKDKEEDSITEEDQNSSDHNDTKMEVMVKMIKKSMASEVIAAFAGAIGVNVLLILGVVYKKPGLLMPWLVLSAVGLSLFALVLVMSPFMLAFFLPPTPALSAIVFFIMLLYFAFGAYFFFAVFTYFQEVSNEFGSGESLCEAPSPKVFRYIHVLYTVNKSHWSLILDVIVSILDRNET
ncbi:uncharacterized protein LOC143024268 isoform X2 [Oratosquilla oratoria]|uniref:uncharacterized protein LOC143024268 isoform X2 n=1 Tax=Oratosquilla oratoria TaxID=337810 RepID=UPI003F75D389